MDGLAANLFSRYNSIMRATFLGVLLIAGGLFWVQVDQSDKAARAQLETRLRESALALNFILKASADNVDDLEVEAEDWFQTNPQPPEPPGLLYTRLTTRASDGFFSLDRVPAPFSAELIGNLTTAARQPDAAVRGELEMALSLNPRFHAIAKLLPNAAWVYYTSANRFINIYPWTPSKDFRYADSLLEKEFFTGGLPENNPKRTRFWTAAYVDEAGKGLMVTVAAPVYQGKTFKGTVAIDLTLDELNRFVKTWDGGSGELFVVNDRDQLLAHPRLVTSKDTAVKTLAEALPTELRKDATAVMAAARETLVDRKGWLVEALRLDQAPFRLVMVVHHGSLTLSILAGAGLTVLALLVGLGLTLILSSRLTLGGFITPSQKLVDYIARKIQDQKTERPEVPGAWEPWFKTIETVFADHGKLAAIQNELDIARTMQQTILPRRFPSEPEVQLYARMLPAKDVGGDFYDFFWLAPGLLGVVVADVSGKGVAAALFMAVARTLIRATAMTSDGPGACFRLVNNLLAEDNDTAMFVTVFYGVFDTASGELMYANAGHCPPSLVDAAGVVSALPGTGGMALGVMEDLEFKEKSVVINPGTKLLFYTDGVTEAFDPAETEFTEARLHRVLTGTSRVPVAGFVDAVVAAVEEFAAGAPQADDLTCLALHFGPPPRTGEA
ncbi:MAG: SpoIIE family protein phosphatase [Rhodospirillaceae bacterium]